MCEQIWRSSIFRGRFSYIIKPKLHSGKSIMKYCEVQLLFIKPCNQTLDAQQKYQLSVAIDGSCHSLCSSPLTSSFMQPKGQVHTSSGASHSHAGPFCLHYYLLNMPPFTHSAPVALAPTHSPNITPGLLLPQGPEQSGLPLHLPQVFDQLSHVLCNTFYIKYKLYMLYIYNVINVTMHSY